MAHGKTVTHRQVFSLYKGPVAGQELFLNMGSYLQMISGLCSQILKAYAAVHL